MQDKHKKKEKTEWVNKQVSKFRKKATVCHDRMLHPQSETDLGISGAVVCCLRQYKTMGESRDVLVCVPTAFKTWVNCLTNICLIKT